MVRWGFLIAIAGLLTVMAAPSWAEPAAELEPALDLETVDGRLDYAASLLERFPNIFRANQQFRRNILEVLKDGSELSKDLGSNAAPRDRHPLTTMTLKYAPGATIAYDLSKIEALKVSLGNDIERLPLPEVTTLAEDLAALKQHSLKNGVFSPEVYKKNLGRLMRVAPVVYDSAGVAHPGSPWKAGASRSVSALDPREIENLFRDGFVQHQQSVIRAAASQSGRGLWPQVLQAQLNGFIKKTVAQALLPQVTSASTSDDKVSARYLRLEEMASPDTLFRGCFGKDCSILSVPYYPEVKGTKTYWLRKSPNPNHPPDGYVFVVPVQVNGKTLPYILTVNGNLTSEDVKKTIQAIGLDWGTSKYVYADLKKNPYLVNATEMIAGLSASDAKPVKVGLPAGWEKVEAFIDQHRVHGYGNYYQAANIENAKIATIETQGRDLLGPIERKTSLPPPRDRSRKILDRPVLDRAILAAEAVEGMVERNTKDHVLERMSLSREQLDAAVQLKGMRPGTGMDANQYERLAKELGFKVKDLLALDPTTVTQSLFLIHDQKPSLAGEEQWRTAYANLWSDALLSGSGRSIRIEKA
jgi:hypothetical protein